MNMRLWLGSAGVVLLSALPAMPFCLAPQPRLVCAEYFRSTLVVTATLITTTPIPEDEPDSPYARVYALRVNRTLRGKAPATLQVYEENSSGRAGFDWVRGREYLLFLNLASDDDATYARVDSNLEASHLTFWELDGCGNSAPTSRAAAALSAIKAIQTGPGGSVIQGVVRTRYGQTPLSGMHVEAQGQDRRFAAITDKNGEFRMRVTPGRYTVKVIDAGRFFDYGELSYSDIDDPLEPGECAQVEFRELPAPPSP